MPLLKRHEARSERNAGAEQRARCRARCVAEPSVRQAWPGNLRQRRGRDSAHLRQSRAAVRAGCICGAAARRRSLRAAGAARPHARWRGWKRRSAGRWTRGARRRRVTAIAFRWVWSCWSRAGSRPCAAAHGAGGAESRGERAAGPLAGAAEELSEELVTRALGLQWSCPVLAWSSTTPKT